VTIGNAPPKFYYELLAPICRQLDLWETEYIHVLPEAAAIVEWMKGTGMRPYLDSLSGPEQESFLEQVSGCVTDAYPRESNGRVLFSFRRLFLVAYR
jgi:trans-aconitate 2-methyltransferase